MIKQINKTTYRITANHGIKFTIRANPVGRGRIYFSIWNNENGDLGSYYIDDWQLDSFLKRYEKAKRFFD